MGKCYEQLSLSERVYVQSQLELGFRAEGRPLPPQGYRADRAHQRAEEKAALPRVRRRLVPGTPLWEMVVDNLRACLSAEQIAGTLKRMAPALAPVRLSHQAIYQAIYAMPRGELRTEAIALWRHGHNKRRPRARGKDRRGQIPNMVSISERPAEIEERLIPGHWEGDTIKGKYNRSAVGTPVERCTLFTLPAKMNGTGAEAAVEGFTRVLDRVEAQAAEKHGIRLEAVKHTEAKRGFILLPRRWVVERSFACAARFRRLARDYERLAQTLAGLHYLAFAILMLAKLIQTTGQSQ